MCRMGTTVTLSCLRRNLDTSQAKMQAQPLPAIIALCTLDTRPYALPALHNHRLVFNDRH